MPLRSLSALITRLGASLLLLAPLLLIASTSAEAHDKLVRSSPADGTTVQTLEKVTLTFSAKVLDTGAAVEVRGPKGAAQQGAPAVQGATVTQALKGLTDGAYTVVWRVLSSDGHPISGSFGFTVRDSTNKPNDQQQIDLAKSSSAVAPTSSSSKPTPPAQQVPTSATDNNAPLVITAAVLSLLLIGAGAFFAKRRLRDDDALGREDRVNAVDDTDRRTDRTEDSDDLSEDHRAGPTDADTPHNGTERGGSTASDAGRQRPGQPSDSDPRD